MERLKLPLSVIGQVDIARLMRELNGLEDFFVSAKARSPGVSMQLPRLTRLLEQLAKDNSLNLLSQADRAELLQSLKTIYEQAPKLHISFAVEPSPKAFEKILAWIRANIHPDALLQVGLQPGIAAGCMLRTTNKVFDMSLRTNLAKQEPYLVKLIKGAADGS